MMYVYTKCSLFIFIDINNGYTDVKYIYSCSLWQGLGWVILMTNIFIVMLIRPWMGTDEEYICIDGYTDYNLRP